MIVKKIIGKLPTLIGPYDSSKVYDKKNRVTLYGSEFESLIDNNTYAPATLDNNEKVVTFDTEHWAVISNGTGAFLAGEKLDQFSFQENPEFVTVNIDADNKIIDSVDNDGNVTHNTVHIFKGGIEDAKGDLKKEALQYALDNSSKLAKTLKEGGYLFSATDWSDYISNDGDKPLHLPIPELAVVNISGIDRMPTTKTQNKKAYIQYWDKQGNYFRKKIIANAQGNSSLNDPKKNIALDFFDNDWDGNIFSTKFGNWVAQDSYHLKAYYGDYFCGKAVIGYELYNEIELVNDINNDRSWKRALIPSDISKNSDYDNEILFDNGARGFPAGFPVIVYLNGDFYGIFSWQIKKHRDNYHQEKKKAEQIHLDGCIDDDNVWLANGTIDWGKWNGKTKNANNNSDGIEIREPKSLIGIDGSKYDFDINPVELIDSTATNYDGSNSDMVRSSKVKQYCTNITKIIPTLKQAKEEGKTASEIKALVSTYFDTKALVNYVIFSDVVYNGDGVNKNWQWLTYDGIKWVVEPYDLDMIMNGNSYLNGHLRNTLDIPYGWIVTYFGDELKAKYKELRDAKIIDAKHITRLLDNWTKRIGIDNYNKELEKWPNKTKTSIYKIYEWLKTEISNMDKLYEYNN